MNNNMPNWVVVFGESRRWFIERHHAEQLMRALQLNGTECRLLHWLEFADECRG